jgi:hypothetical protein
MARLALLSVKASHAACAPVVVVFVTVAEREAEEARRRLRAQHRQLAKQRQHAMLPGAARRGAAPVANKGRALLQNAQRMQADKVSEPAGLDDLSRGQQVQWLPAITSEVDMPSTYHAERLLTPDTACPGARPAPAAGPQGCRLAAQLCPRHSRGGSVFR